MRKSPSFGLYGERFMPILLDDEKLYYGFALDNCHEIEPLKTPTKIVKDFNKFGTLLSFSIFIPSQKMFFLFFDTFSHLSVAIILNNH
jgi:hypothetical protein